MNNKKLNEQIVVAIRNEKLSDIKKLLKEGADPNHVFKIDDREFSLLHMAIFYEDMPYVKLLVESGADINKLSYVNGKKNKLGNLTPIQFTVLNGTQEPDNFKVLKYLLSKEANIYIRNSTGNHTRDLAKFREKKDKNKKYLKTIDDFIKGKNKLREKLQAAALEINQPNKKKKSAPKKKVSIKDQRKASIKQQKGGNNLNGLEERLLQNFNIILNSM
jgi:ankyrin repeat protein